MYPLPIDPNRLDNMTTQVHMLRCPCNGVMYPYYPFSYRPPILAQPQPIARPSYLHHYQYTQLHVNPTYNVPLQPTISQYKRNDSRDSLLQYTSLSTVDEDNCNTASAQNSNEDLVDLNAIHVANMPINSYITYLANGCVMGEKIAKRNEHRPFFKNIQNLCNRTRSEVLKPNITVSNIYSQGMPWATKDFIFAYVRVTNCWCILRRYLEKKDGNLGNVDREISPEFRNCFNKWEKCTKQLSYYLIDTFCKLHEANSPSNIQVLNNYVNMFASTTIPLPPPTNVNAQPESPKETVTFSPTVTQSTQTINYSFDYIPFDSSMELDIPIQLLECPEASQPEDDSESESHIYLEPGSYNNPKKRSTTPSSIEFLDTAQIVEGRKKNVYESHDLMQSYDLSCDEMWQTAKSVTPSFIRQIEESLSVDSEKEYDCSIIPFQNKNIENWLNNKSNKFSSSDPFNNLLQIDESLPASTSYDGSNIINKPVMDSKSSKYTNPESNSNLSLKKRGELADIRPYRRQPLFTREASSSTWDCKKGKLTESITTTLYRIFSDLERTDFAGHETKKLPFNAWTDTEINNPTNLSTVAEKLKRSYYTYLSEFVHDIRHIMSNPNAQCADRKYLKHLAMFNNKFDELLEQEFPNLDFNNVTGDSKELFGLLSLKEGASKKADEDGNH